MVSPGVLLIYLNMLADIHHSFGHNVIHVNTVFGYTLDYDLDDSGYIRVVNAQYDFIIAFFINEKNIY